MPDCRHCVHLDPSKPQCMLAPIDSASDAHRKHKARVKACETAVLMKYADQFSGDVLEVGPGVYKVPRNTIKRRATWYGIDPAWDDNPTEKAYKSNVSNIPFPNDRFDWVVSFASIEHWGERGDMVEDGLREIFRVMKPGGHLLVTSQYFNHGHDLFYLGQRDRIGQIFRSVPWYNIEFEEWSAISLPLSPLQEWRIERHRIEKLLIATNGVEPFTSTLEVFARK